MAGAVAAAVSITSLFSGVGAASAADAWPDIVGGTPAAHAFTVSLQSESASGALAHECGGTLIDERWVLTAAHCEQWIHGRARVGSTRWNDGGQLIPVAAVYSNPLHDSAAGFGNDSALVRLTSAVVPVDEGTTPVAIRRAGPVGTPGLATGWGLTCDRDLDDETCTSQRPTVLQQLDQQRVPDRTCDLVNANGVQLNHPATMNCVENRPPGKRAGTCFGDSGSGWFEALPDGTVVVTGIVNAIMNTTTPVPHACSQTPTGGANRDGVTDAFSQRDSIFATLCPEDPAAAHRVARAAHVLAPC